MRLPTHARERDRERVGEKERGQTEWVEGREGWRFFSKRPTQREFDSNEVSNLRKPTKNTYIYKNSTHAYEKYMYIHQK